MRPPDKCPWRGEGMRSDEGMLQDYEVRVAVLYPFRVSSIGEVRRADELLLRCCKVCGAVIEYRRTWFKQER